MASGHLPADLRIRLLGTFSIQLQGSTILSVNGPRLQSLFANLVIHPGVPRQRRQLAASLWPETTDEQSQTNLRTVVHRLRVACPVVDRFLHVEGSYLLWNADPDCWTDAVEFEAVARGATALSPVEDALRIYGGELLPGCSDPWLEPERDRLRRLHIQLLDRAIGLHEASGEYRPALEYARLVAGHEPFNEDNQGRLIRLHALSGDRAGGMRAYEAFESVLRTELGTQPGPLIQEAYRRLRADMVVEARTGGAVAPDSVPHLIGRAAAWESLRKLWSEVQSGETRVAVVAGEAGIGKTRLAEEFANWAERQGISTARGRAYRMSGGLVFAPIVSWLRQGINHRGLPVMKDPWLAEVARVVPELLQGNLVQSGASEGLDYGRQERFFEALAHAVLRSPQPLLLVLDDLQWCDADLLAWLRFLLSSAPSRILLLLTWRSDELTAADPSTVFLRDLERGGLLTRIELEPLDAEHSAALAAEVAVVDGGPPPPSTYAIAQGNPLFLIEMVRAARGGEALGGAEAQAAFPTASSVPPTVRGLIQERLERLAPDHRLLVGAAAAIGRNFDLQLLSLLSGASADRTGRALDELCVRRVLAEEPGDLYDFHHELVREVAYSELGTHKRRQLHRAVAEALAQDSAQSRDRLSEIAAHYDRAGLVTEAMSFYLRAARQMSQTGSTVAAIAQLERAAALAGPAGGETDLTLEIREQLGDLLHVAARYEDARRQFALASAALDQPLHRARLCRKIARTRTGERDFRQAAESLEDAREMLNAASERGPDWSHEWLQLSLDRMGVLYWTTDWNTIGQMRLEIGAELDRHGTPAQRRQFRFSLLGMLLRRDRLVISDEMIVLAQENLESALVEGSATAVAVTRFQLAYVLLWSREPALAEDHLVEALALAERTADRTLACRCLTYLCVLYRKLQLPQRTREYAALALEAATELANREYTGVSFANQAWLSWKRQRFGEALERGRAALAEWSDRPVGGVPFAAQWLALWPLLASRLATGSDRDTVPDALEFARALLDHDQARLPDELSSCLAQAMAASGEGDVRRAERRLVRATELARLHGYL